MQLYVGTALGPRDAPCGRAGRRCWWGWAHAAQPRDALRYPKGPITGVHSRPCRAPRAISVVHPSAVVGQSQNHGVPIISTFFGITIRMFYREHGVPHFHAEHQGQQATFTFDGNMLAGELRSRTALRLVRDWATMHEQELTANWERIEAGERLERIAPLE
jgi:hypothetical protein